MAFKITILDKEGNVKDWNELDSEVCSLWQVPFDPKHWCKAPEESYSKNWHEFLGHCVILMRAYGAASRTCRAADFFKGLIEFGRWRPDLDVIQRCRCEIQLLLYWISMDYEFKIENG